MAIGVSRTLSVAEAGEATAPAANTETDNKTAETALTMNRIDLELFGLEDFSPLGIRMDKA
jgi:hypothetical protein